MCCKAPSTESGLCRILRTICLYRNSMKAALIAMTTTITANEQALLLGFYCLFWKQLATWLLLFRTRWTSTRKRPFIFEQLRGGKEISMQITIRAQHKTWIDQLRENRPQQFSSARYNHRTGRAYEEKLRLRDRLVTSRDLHRFGQMKAQF